MQVFSIRETTGDKMGKLQMSAEYIYSIQMCLGDVLGAGTQLSVLADC